MTRTNGYVGVKFHLTKSQEDNIKTAYLERRGVTLKLNKNKISPNSDTMLYLTKAQYQKLQDGNEHNITISHSRLRGSHTGGFLPFLIPLLAGLASAAGIAGGVTTAVAKAKEAQKFAAEKKLIEQQIKNGSALALPAGPYGFRSNK